MQCKSVCSTKIVAYLVRKPLTVIDYQVPCLGGFVKGTVERLRLKLADDGPP